jgi:hypothetical protein
MTNEELAKEIMQSCSLHYTHPEMFTPDDPQRTLDMALENAKSILSKHLEGEWVKVSERLPESRTWVIVCTEHDGKRHVVPGFGVRLKNDDNRWRWESEFPVTHWMPLPPSPDEAVTKTARVSDTFGERLEEEKPE